MGSHFKTNTHPCPGPHAFSLACIFFSLLVNKNNYSCFLVIEAMGCVVLFLKQSLKRLLCREGRAVPSHTECLLPDFKMRTFAFIPKLKKLVWDLKTSGCPMSSVTFPCCLTWRLSHSGCAYWFGGHDTWLEHADLLYFPFTH